MSDEDVSVVLTTGPTSKALGVPGPNVTDTICEKSPISMVQGGGKSAGISASVTEGWVQFQPPSSPIGGKYSYSPRKRGTDRPLRRAKAWLSRTLHLEASS